MIGLLLMLAANSVYVSGNDLYADCTGDVDAQIRCNMYITGVNDGGAMMQVATRNETFFCVPAGVNRKQLVDITTTYLRDHPENRHLNAGGIVLVSLKGAFPCQP